MRCIGGIDFDVGARKGRHNEIRRYALVIEDSWLLNDTSQRLPIIRGWARLAGHWAWLGGGFRAWRVGGWCYWLLAGGAAVDELQHRCDYAGDWDAEQNAPAARHRRAHQDGREDQQRVQSYDPAHQARHDHI